MVGCLLQDESPDGPQDAEDFVEQMELIGRFVHLLHSEDADSQFLVSGASTTPTPRLVGCVAW